MSLCAENSNDECWDCAGEWGGSSTLVDCCSMGNIDACQVACDEFGDPDACQVDCDVFGDFGACQVACEYGLYDLAQCCVWEFGTSNGDANEDTNVTVTDLVLIIDNILDGTISDELICSSDVNSDGTVDVIDIIAIVDLIVNE